MELTCPRPSPVSCSFYMIPSISNQEALFFKFINCKWANRNLLRGSVPPPTTHTGLIVMGIGRKCHCHTRTQFTQFRKSGIDLQKLGNSLS